MPSVFTGPADCGRQQQLVPTFESGGRPNRSKTVEFDDSVAIDSKYMKPWAPALCAQLKKGKPEQPLWDFDYTHFSNMSLTPYQLRHSGPSIGRAADTRSLLEVQKRGRWKSFKSVAANFGQLSRSLQVHCH